MAEQKAARRYGRTMLASSRYVINEDAVDARLVREAREAGEGKARFTVNELRAQRGLAAIRFAHFFRDSIPREPVFCPQ